MIKINCKNKDIALEKHIIACINGIGIKIKGFEKALINKGQKAFLDKVTKLDLTQKKKLEDLLYLLNSENFLKELLTINTNEIDNFTNKYNLQGYITDLAYTSETKVKGIIDYIFNYQTFSNTGFQLNNNRYWNVYELVKFLNVSVCPYCNRNYIFTAIKFNSNKGTRPEIDHLYPQKKYPFFKLSFYNLIPSCHTCNHLKSVNHKNLISPHNDDLIEKFKFVYVPQDVDSLYGYGNNHQVILSPIKNYENRIKIHDETFLLNQLYSNHGDIIQELLLKRRIAGKDYRKKIRILFNNKFSDYEIKRFAFGNYLKQSDFHKRPLAKFFYDIADELKLI